MTAAAVATAASRRRPLIPPPLGSAALIAAARLHCSMVMRTIPTRREGTAAHEAGHAVMRWLRRLPPTPIAMSDDDRGECGGTGQLYPAKDVLLVTLAG